MPVVDVEKRGGSEKRGTGIASKIRQTNGTNASAARAAARSSQPGPHEIRYVGAHTRRNQQAPSIVAASGGTPGRTPAMTESPGGGFRIRKQGLTNQLTGFKFATRAS